VTLEHRVDSTADAAAILRSSIALETASTVLLCNPVPASMAMDSAEVADAAREAETQADAAGIDGKARTPFLLATLAELTGGRSLESNLALLEANARLAGEVAVEAARS
jgi:pseudouridine-5'-phosphate glycosidase